jgi:hypothetical protein
MGVSPTVAMFEEIAAMIVSPVSSTLSQTFPWTLRFE